MTVIGETLPISVIQSSLNESCTAVVGCQLNHAHCTDCTNGNHPAVIEWRLNDSYWAVLGWGRQELESFSCYCMAAEWQPLDGMPEWESFSWH